MADTAAANDEGSPTGPLRSHVKAMPEQISLLQTAFSADAHPTAETKQLLGEQTGL